MNTDRYGYDFGREGDLVRRYERTTNGLPVPARVKGQAPGLVLIDLRTRKGVAPELRKR